MNEGMSIGNKSGMSNWYTIAGRQTNEVNDRKTLNGKNETAGGLAFFQNANLGIDSSKVGNSINVAA